MTATTSNDPRKGARNVRLNPEVRAMINSMHAETQVPRTKIISAAIRYVSRHSEAKRHGIIRSGGEIGLSRKLAG